MTGFITNIEDRTEDNNDFRRALFTGPHLQLVLMSLQPGEEIGEEVHADTDQFFRVEAGTGEARIEGRPTRLTEGMALVIPAGARHNIQNIGHVPLQLYTLYAPPHHPAGTVQRTKADAVLAEAGAP
jgi:mannose-6-phosphate isomerase-like protein (cupin superfamily)